MDQSTLRGFSAFASDQEHLISSSTRSSFDYVEGFVIIDRTGLLNNRRSSFDPKDPVRANQFTSEGKILFCLEVAKYYNPEESDHIDQEVDGLLSELDYIKSTLFMSEVSYPESLDRVHVWEMKLREKGLWEVPHPWINLLIPRSKIEEFAHEVFENIVKDTSNGPVLIYPVNQTSPPETRPLDFFILIFVFSAPTDIGLEIRKITRDQKETTYPERVDFPSFLNTFESSGSVDWCHNLIRGESGNFRVTLICKPHMG